MDPVIRPLKAAADPSRLRILRALTVGPFHVAELQDILGLGQSTVSRHLRVLADAGLVDVRRTGTWAWYSLRPSGDDFAGRLLRILSEDAPKNSGRLNGDAAAIREALERRRRATTAFFRRTAPEWDALRDGALGPPAHLERLLQVVGRPETVVDLGTGTGFLLEPLAGIGGRVIGVDASPEMLQLARGRAPSHAELRLGALEHLPLSDGEADAMVANMVMHHVANPPEVLREIRRGLKPGGRLVIADLEEHDRESFWQTLGAQWPGFRRDDVARWLEDAGFADVRFETIPSPAIPAPAIAPSASEATSGARPDVFLLGATRA